MALDFRQSSFRHVTRVSPSSGFSVFSPFSAVSAGSCPLALSGSGEPLTQGCPLHPSHLRWGCCMHSCGAPEAGGSQVQRCVSVPPTLRAGLIKMQQDRSPAEPLLPWYPCSAGSLSSLALPALILTGGTYGQKTYG